MLAPLHSASSDDAEGAAQAEALQADPLLLELVDLAATTSKSAFVSKLVCSECLGDDTQEACLNQACPACSFARIWSRGLRPKVMADPSRSAVQKYRH